MDLDIFRKAVISLDGFLGRLGIIGGEPLLHPKFEEICLILKDEFKIPRKKLGLWTSGGKHFEKYRKLIKEVFGMLAFNEHNKEQRKVELHQPLTIAIEEVVKDEKYKQDLINNCWVQNTWCPSINPKGAFFCEVAQALDIILDGPGGYPIEPGWWKKTAKEFKDQVDRYCKYCGAPIPLKKELLDNEKQKFSPGLLSLFKKHNLKCLSGEFVDIFDRQLTIKEMEENKLKWDPRHYRQDLKPDMKEGYKKRPLKGQVMGPLKVIKGEMNILACGVVYNEMDILPYLLEYYKSQGVEVFIFDNFSDDGTWEYLQGNKIACERISSNGKFSLVQFIKRMTAKWQEIKPDWCVYLDADEFPLTFQFSSLKELIKDRDKQGFNVIKQIRVNFRPTGLEDFSKGDPREIYKYYFIDLPGGKGHPQCERIFKYSDKINLVKKAGHFTRGFDKRVSIEPLDNPIFHYSMREGAKEKTLQRFNRRNKDEETIGLKWNTHYKRFIEKDMWVWNKDKLSNMEDPKDIFYKIRNKQD